MVDGRVAVDGRATTSAGLEGADVDSAVPRIRPRWSVVMPLIGDAAADGRAAGQQGHGLGRPAVIAQRGQHGVERLGDGAGQVGADPAGAAVGLADQVVALEVKVPKTSGAIGGGRVPATIVLPRVTVPPSLNRPPPIAAELPLTVQLVSVSVPVLIDAAAEPLVELLKKVQPMMVSKGLV